MAQLPPILGHHLVSWLDGGATDLPNLALLCRAHHRAVHEGGWQVQRIPMSASSRSRPIDDPGELPATTDDNPP